MNPKPIHFILVGAAIICVGPILVGLIFAHYAGANAGMAAGLIFFAVILFIGFRYAKKVTGKGKDR